MGSDFLGDFCLAYAEKLIDDQWQYGPKEHMTTLYPKASDGGITCQPSALGAELFLNAFGHADKNLEYIFEKTFLPVVENIPNQIPGAVHIGK